MSDIDVGMTRRDKQWSLAMQQLLMTISAAGAALMGWGFVVLLAVVSLNLVLVRGLAQR